MRTASMATAKQSAGDRGATIATGPNHEDGFMPYARDPKTLARPWAIPGTPGLTHRIGGLEKEDVTGDISYDGANHARMTKIRDCKVAGIAAYLPQLEVDEDPGAELLVLGWGSSRGAIRAAARRVRASGHVVAVAHLHHLNPLPTNVGELLRRYDRVLVPEMNTGQLAQILRAKFLVDVESYCKLEGKPLFAAELERELMERL